MKHVCDHDTILPQNQCHHSAQWIANNSRYREFYPTSSVAAESGSDVRFHLDDSFQTRWTQSVVVCVHTELFEIYIDSVSGQTNHVIHVNTERNWRNGNDFCRGSFVNTLFFFPFMRKLKQKWKNRAFHETLERSEARPQPETAAGTEILRELCPQRSFHFDFGKYQVSEQETLASAVLRKSALIEQIGVKGYQ